jgi:hypothetical protein
MVVTTKPSIDPMPNATKPTLTAAKHFPAGVGYTPRHRFETDAFGDCKKTAPRAPRFRAAQAAAEDN